MPVFYDLRKDIRFKQGLKEGFEKGLQESLEKVKSHVSESERFKESHYAKALIHTFLAWKEPPGRPFGQAINANFFNEKTELLTQFIDWLNRLFGE